MSAAETRAVSIRETAVKNTGPHNTLSHWSNSELLKVLAFVLLFTWYPLHPLRGMHSSAVVDPDVWWHMRTGEWILQHLSLPHVDPFSITGMGKPWVAYSWPFEILIYKIAQNWDLMGIVGFAIFMWVVVTAVLFRFVRGLLPDFWRAAGLTFFGSLTMMRVFSPRPGVITTLLFIIVLDVLLSAQRNDNRRSLLVLPVVMLVWANVHVQFVYGIFLIGVFCVEPLLNRLFRYQSPAEFHLPSKTLWPLFLASTLATLINPYGIGVY